MSNTCKSCKAKIVWCKTDKGKFIPVDMYSLPESDKVLLIDRWRNGDETPLAFNPQKHTAHFATCPHAAEHRRKEIENGNA
jgi:hypothetical protein